MTIEDGRLRERDARRRLITTTARALAEREGWAAVTTRRLSSEIEYSQPVIYKHFASLEDLVGAIALEGFDELARALGDARRAAPQSEALKSVAHAYSAFAVRNTALYDAMFTATTALRFGTDDEPGPLAAAFFELRAAVLTVSGDRDPDTLSEVFWSALHGLATLGRSGRLRTSHDLDRIDTLVTAFAP